MSQPALTSDALMRLSPVIPVRVVDEVDHAAPLAHALVEGGLKVLELTLRTPAALKALEAMRKAVPDAVVGAGTVINADQLKRAVDAGAQFIVSPGLTKKVVRAAEDEQVPILPGVATAGEIMRGLDLGLDRFKFFPAETSGGAPAIAAFAGPFAQVRFCPTGGISPANAASYLGQKTVNCVGGGWVAPAAAVREGDWAKITTLAREAAALPRAALA